MNTLLQERLLAVKLARQSQAVHILELRALATGTPVAVPSKRKAKSGKRWTQLERNKRSQSMLSPKNTHPAPFKRVMGQLDDRTLTLLAAHQRRLGAGWIRG